ncbi:MAG: DinB family protein [Cyclobacteriaceae bacterium]|nr:DinB family protein [Cyclobacteriaceae bacterium]
MQLSSAAGAILNQLSRLVEQLRDNDMLKPSRALSNSTIGQHLRHTLEFFICLEEGYDKGLVNYDKRNHDKLIETDKAIALGTIQRIIEFVNHQQKDQPLKLEVGYHPTSEESLIVETNYFRELTYNIEHAVHHMAIMKIGIHEVAPYISLPPDFGVAVSTLRYHQNQTLATT